MRTKLKTPTADDYIRTSDGRFVLPEFLKRETMTPSRALAVNFATTDLGNAQRLARHCAGLAHYCYERKMWLVWNGRSWEWDRGDKITSLAKEAVRQIYTETALEPDDKKRKELADHARRSESEHRIRAMISLAQSEIGIPVKVTELDKDPWLFNCLSGTLDLRTGKLLPHKKQDLLTVLVPIEYAPNTNCPLWLKFLDRVTAGNTELQSYLQRAVGYSLTGITKVQVLFFLYGLGNNGKSTFVTLIRKLTGDYGERVSTDLFMIKDKTGSGPKEGLANLRGRRFVVASELEDGKRLAVSLIKDMTGGESIKADRKYEHEVEYQPSHKLWLVGNHKPVITDTTLSIWRRVKLIPFTVTIPPNEIDEDLPEKLEAELPGILAWAVLGCLDWRKYGLNEPNIISAATASYRHDQDILGDFIEDCCILEPLASISKTDLKDSYSQWCQANTIEPITQRTFKARLIERGITEGRAGKARLWKGIRLRIDTDSDKSDKSLDDLALEVTRVTENTINSYTGGIHKKFMENHVTVVTNVTNNRTSPKDLEFQDDPLNTSLQGENLNDSSSKSGTLPFGMPVEKVIALWQSEGKPKIHLRAGEDCSNLELLLSSPLIPAHREAIKTWLAEVVKRKITPVATPT
jgi:putative DNA primase/helicase